MTALALLSDLSRMGVRLTRAGNTIRVVAPPGVISQQLRAEMREQKAGLIAALDSQAVTLRRLLTIADSEGMESTLIRSLPGEDVVACENLSDEVLRAYLRALSESELRKQGAVPADETAIALCRHCGPIWTHPQVAAIAPKVDGIPYVLGCPWCHVPDRSVVPHPTLPGIEP